MRLGERQVLTVVKKVEFGVYLGSDEERVLLPKKQVPEEIEVGDPIEVFLYKDSSDRMIATTREPKITIGKLAVLEVVDVGRIGAFLDWGLEKDLLLPFKEQTTKVEKGDRCLVSLYIDKSGRLCATMKVYPLLRTDPPYKKDDTVQGTVYEVSREFGVFVAVDNKYSALIPRREVYGRMYPGQKIEARVAAVKADGKLDLSIRHRIPEQMDADAQKIVERMEKSGGVLPFTDKADPERIRDELGMSKAAFKRAVGRLLKQGKINIGEAKITLQSDAKRL
ncbi:MAG TPA: S1 RNA-binding domain-containing protein [Candidatus Mediterraneibacter faecavium]|uniref:S1 RNA-binding domain-containing protein n=1 Tax=Candidatus Mediterraneibacter faecavium TaxID=2838668 RepID=A0A9D2TMC3_9FIRM|nr:S1 RNA-binding domain-containing protein [Candidatus Mediterraneibacter faecavium]